jgi:hypothetical protein
MAMYAFMVPILPGKTETLKKYMQEIKSSRWDELVKSRERMGVHAVQAWIQHTPNGDVGAVWMDVDNPSKFFDMLMNSDEPFDKWFREKVVIECQGIKPGTPPPDKNELVLDYKGKEYPSKTKTYEEAHKK